MSRIELDDQEPERPARDQAEISETLKNRHLRQERLPKWRAAEPIREYWRARLDMESAISAVHSHHLPEGDNHRPYHPDDRTKAVANWRQAIAQQLLTLAPDTRAGRVEKGGPGRWTVEIL
jgi:hypothetical protein